MRKLFIILLGFVTINAFAANDRPISYEQLPQKAKQFLTQHFNDAEFLSAVLDDGVYEVKLTNGVEIDFNSQGDWKEVDCHNTAVPTAIIPAAITKYVKAKFAKNIIVKIEKKHYGYDVELNNDLDLKFDKNGDFLRIDD